MTLPSQPLLSGPGGPLSVPPLPKRCGCCQKTRTDPDDIERFGTLTDATGYPWSICGKCIQYLWRKRHPRPDKM